MKKLLVLIIACLLSFGVFSQHDKYGIVYGIKAGLNISTVSTGLNERADPKTGLQAGVYGRVKLSDSFAFRPELNYSSQGVGNPGFGTVSMHYLNAPLLLEFGKKFNVHAGPQAGFLMGAESSYFSVERFTRFELAIVTGVGYYTDGHYNFGARYTVGVTNLYEDKSVNSFSRVIHFYVAYTF
jgi:hypothetical protein